MKKNAFHHLLMASRTTITDTFSDSPARLWIGEPSTSSQICSHTSGSGTPVITTITHLKLSCTMTSWTWPREGKSQRGTKLASALKTVSAGGQVPQGFVARIESKESLPTVVICMGSTSTASGLISQTCPLARTSWGSAWIPISSPPRLTIATMGSSALYKSTPDSTCMHTPVSFQVSKRLFLPWVYN